MSGDNNPFCGLSNFDRIVVCAACKVEGKSCFDSTHALDTTQVEFCVSLASCTQSGRNSRDDAIACMKSGKRWEVYIYVSSHVFGQPKLSTNGNILLQMQYR